LKLLSVIIVNFRGWERLRMCLDSLSDIDGNNLSFEVIVVDNHSNDGKLGLFEERYPHFKFVLNSGNNGFAHGCNTGAKNANGECFLFLNPDTVVSEGALVELLESARNNPLYYIITCSQVKEDGSEDLPFGFFPSVRTITGLSRAIYRLVNKKKLSETVYSDSDVIFPDWISGSVMMIERGSFEEIGGWNEKYWLYFEDVDICKRARDAGGEVALFRNISIEHNHGGASRINPRTAALTKTEVLISNHIYIAENEKGLTKILMHAILVINNVVMGFIPVVIGTLLFFSPKLSVLSRRYFLLIKYYLSALVRKSWDSPRAITG
jgi:GT2 family glycosyltransferase